MSDGEVRVMPRALVAGDVGAFAYGARLGFVYRSRSETYAGSPIGNEAYFAASAGVHVADRKLLVGPEIFGTTYVDDGFKTRSTPLEGLLGAHYQVTPDLRVGGGVGAGLTRGYGAPVVRGLLSVEWSPEVVLDRDHDGIADDKDACPDVPGIASDDPAKNGCPPPPPPSDRDKDGIVDSTTRASTRQARRRAIQDQRLPARPRSRRHRRQRGRVPRREGSEERGRLAQRLPRHRRRRRLRQGRRVRRQAGHQDE
ncbi:MAG: hypothetical protein U0235_27180 [Polyangiaceae bacterium]